MLLRLLLVLGLLLETLGYAVVPHPPAAQQHLHEARHGKVIRVDKSAYHSSRNAAFRSLKRDLHISRGQRPDKVTSIPMTNREGKAVLHNGVPVMTREYHFTRSDGSMVVIQDHGFGHDFGEADGKGNQGPHFNPRPLDPLTGNGKRTGEVEGTHEHYSW